MLKKRLTIGARARNKKNGDCDGVIKSILGSGKQLLEWSDKETEEEVNSRSMFRFAKVEEEAAADPDYKNSKKHFFNAVRYPHNTVTQNTK